MDGSEIKVMFGSREVGRIFESSNPLTLCFKYSQEWSLSGFPLSPSMPLNGMFSDEVATFFFQNTLPEGKALTILSKHARLPESSVLGLCLYMRNDLVGAIRLENKNFPQQPRSFRAVTFEELAERLDSIRRYPITVWDGRPRLSLAGCQEKLNVLKFDNHFGLADGPDFCSDRILKFEAGSIPNLLLNEFLSLRLAREAGFVVNDARLISIPRHRVLEIIRFDRTVECVNGNVVVRRRHVIDGCQALGLVSERKYERNYSGDGYGYLYADGVSFVKLASLSEFMSDPLKYKIQLLDWMILNLLIGNSDGHGKNISFTRSPNGFVVAPWYDLVNIRLCDGIDQSLAMSIGEQFTFEDVHALQVLWEADNLGLSKGVVSERLTKIVENVFTALDKVKAPDFSTKEELLFTHRWKEDVKKACLKWRSEIKELPYLKL